MRSDKEPIERLIERALSDYSNAEPRLGLEQRVLNRVRAEARKSPLRLGMKTVAIAAVCIAALTVALWAPRVAHPDPPANALPVKTPVIEVSMPMEAKRTVVTKRQRHRPTPLTQQENALLILAQHSPKVLNALSDDKPVAIQPIEISALKLQPLAPETEE